MANRLLPVVIIVQIVRTLQAADVHIFVSPNGSDHNNGTSAKTPMQTIQSAWQTITHLPDQNGTAYMELMAGYHDLPGPLVIRRGNVVIRSYNSQEVHVTGGKRIPSAAFKPVTDQHILSRLPANARQHVRFVYLPDFHITYYGQLGNFGSGHRSTAPLEVSCNGKPLELARWPDEGFINVVDVPDGKHGLRFRYNSSVPNTWHNESDPWVYGFWSNSYSDLSEKVKALDTENSTVTLTESPSRGINIGYWGDPKADWRKQGGYFRFINILGALDQPGEYYLDRQSGNLYVWMPTGDGNINNSDIVYASQSSSCITINSHVKNVVIKDFTVESCRREGIYGSNVQSVEITNMEIRNTGLEGVLLVGDSRDVRIAQCLVHDTNRGIRVSGGDRKTLESSGIIVDDNEIYDFTRTGAAGYNGIDISGLGGIVRHNHVYSGRYAGVSYSGNDHTIEYNFIHHTCKEIASCGAIHSGTGDWTARGNLVQSNIVGDTVCTVPGGDNYGISIDAQFSSTTVSNNVFYNTDTHVQIGGGRDNIIVNNILYNATHHSIAVDDRGLRTDTNHQNYQKTLIHRLMSVPFNSSAWTMRYPELQTFDLQTASYPEGNKIFKNIVYNTHHADFLAGLNDRIDEARFYNVSTIGFSVGEGDHFNIAIGDYRIRCIAAEWANHVNFQQVPSPNEVGPRFPPGPAYLHRGLVQMVNLTAPGPCTTHAPARREPIHSYLPDGSHSNGIFNVTDEGCWLSVSKCTNHESSVGTYRDMYAERYQHAADNATMCFQWAIEKWNLCGAEQHEPIAAIYGPTGAMTYVGDGCFLAMYGCPRHGGPADGHVTPGKLTRDFYAEYHRNASIDEEACLQRALEQWKYCGSSRNHPVTAVFRPKGTTRTAGAGCWIETEHCTKRPNLRTMFYDSWGATNHESDDIEIACLNEAEYYWTLCGSDQRYPVTAHFRPTTASKTFP